MKEQLLDEQRKELTRTQKWKIKQAQDYIKVVEFLLYFIGGVTLLMTFFNKDLLLKIDIGISIGLALVFIIGGFSTRYRPFLSISITLIIYILIHGLQYLMHPSSLMSGVIFKLTTIIFFVIGLFSAMKINKIKKSIEEQGIPPRE